MRDELYNPFDSVTEDMLYADVEQLNQSVIQQKINEESTIVTTDRTPSELDLSVELLLSNDMLVMERKRYNLWDLLGDIGGFNDGLILVLQIFMSKYSALMFEHSIVQGSHY